jgi:hypothetical protein
MVHNLLPQSTKSIIEADGAFTLNLNVEALKSDLKSISYKKSQLASTVIHSLDLNKCLNTGLIGEILSQMNNFFSDCSLRQVFLVTDTNAASAANQKFHFDTIPSIKVIVNLSDHSKGGTQFAIGSHKGWRQKINKLVVNKGIYGHHKLGFQNVNVNKYSKIDTKGSNAAIFDTDTIHRALVDTAVSEKDPRKTLIIAFTKPH